ncbi:ABC transporter permease [Larkinella terrae]|uniref:FtsX-like permease family protein n=1 Tax=Larkinella terrae TaxID=2025311 RepID=A0A7K0ELP8_9BACT|nr:ABC transporter permease [Larkinella terrae]MRS62773.1 FtsX-like permease family protein [Larkinella terrae]
MLRHYSTVVFRTILRNKIYTGIVITGLAFGMAAFLLISGYVRFEQSYDRIHPNGDRVYRVESVFYKNGVQTEHWATSSNGYVPAMKQAFPEIEAFTRIAWRGSTRVVRYEEAKFREDHVCFADSNFFTFFGYPVLKGDRRTFLTSPNTIVISESAARRYFGNADPLGKYLDVSTIASSYHCEVTGVFADLPSNSTMQFSMLMSFATSNRRNWDFWYQHESYSFVRLKPQTDPAKLIAKFPALSEKYKTAEALRDHVWSIDLVPLHDIHLNPATQNEIEIKGNRRAVQFLSVIAFVILIIGWVNYINLSTARAMDRAKEIGIRKTIGSHQSLLVFQFLFESLLLNVLALVLAVLLVVIAHFVLPGFLDIPTTSFDWSEPTQYAVFAVIFLVGIVVSGIYPALVLSRVKPVLALKGQYRFTGSGAVLRKGLVVFQFMASMILIVGTFVAGRQLAYMMNQDLGVRVDQVLVLKAPVKTDHYAQKTQTLKNDLRAVPGITEVTGSGAVPGKEVGQMLANRRLHEGPESDRLYEMLMIDFDFLKTYDLQLAAGRAFDRSRPADSTGLILNESAVRQFGFKSNEDAIGEKILLEVTHDRPNEIIGVVKDYHQQGLQKQFTPLILFMDPDYRWLPTDYYSLKISTNQVDGLVEKVQTVWGRFFPESSMDYFFLDDFFNRQYRQDRQFGRTFILFSSLAILIACMGLFGMTSYNTARRTKEIGVRKVLGASVASVLRLLAWESMRLLLVAGLLAIPVSWYSIHQWLSVYAFRIELNPFHWLIPMLVLVLIALATISFQTIKAALNNPTKSLQNE